MSQEVNLKGLPAYRLAILPNNNVATAQFHLDSLSFPTCLDNRISKHKTRPL